MNGDTIYIKAHAGEAGGRKAADLLLLAYWDGQASSGCEHVFGLGYVRE
ncbi:hypothetical protein [Streptomyces sp. SID3343]|nr:hypothetical protein [Streptomyces sp. SID3343]